MLPSYKISDTVNEGQGDHLPSTFFVPKYKCLRIHTGSASTGLPKGLANAIINFLLTSIDKIASLICGMEIKEKDQVQNKGIYCRNSILMETAFFGGYRWHVTDLRSKHIFQIGKVFGHAPLMEKIHKFGKCQQTQCKPT